ncbi:MAG: response regulator [Dehalococcoidales bacterium]
MAEKMKILVVDDNEEFCQNITDILELKDYEVTTAYDGFRGLELVEQNGFDLVLMDIRMPVMNGVETFKRVKEIAPDTQVIMVTAFSVEDLIKEALREGAFGALRKPLDFDSLFELISQTAPDGDLILVVDDDENLCANMADVLGDKGYRVSVAYDGETAVAKAESNNFDVLLIDMRLPPLNGLETYLAIREFRPNMTAIIITGYRDDMKRLVDQALEKNAYTCLEKPLNMDELVSMLERVKEQKNEDDSGKIT